MVLPPTDPNNDLPDTVDRPTDSIRPVSGSVENLGEGQVAITIDFASELPPLDRDRLPSAPLPSYSILVELDSTGDYTAAFDQTVNDWELSGYGPNDSFETVDSLPNVTVGPTSVLLVLELKKFAALPKKLDPTVDVFSSFTGARTIFFPLQECA